MKFPFMKVPKQQPVNLTKADDLREQIFPRGRGGVHSGIDATSQTIRCLY